MAELRAFAEFPLEDDTLPDRDTFKACYGASLEYNNASDNHTARYTTRPMFKAWVRQQIILKLKTRKRLVAFKASEPDKDQRRLPRLLVVGLPRTGTTILSRLLFTLPEIWGPTLRQMKSFPTLGTDFEEKLHTFFFDLVKLVSPVMFAIHPVELDDHEEDQMLMRLSGEVPWRGMQSWEGHLEERKGWTKHIGMIYQQLRENLDLLATQHAPVEATHMICKFPLHGLYPEELCQQASHPDQPVVLIRTYRKSLAKAAESFITLFCAIYDTMTYEYATAVIEEQVCDLVETIVDGFEKMDQLAAQEPDRIKVVDVAFDDLCKSPVETILKLREVMGLPAYDDIRRGEMAKLLSKKTEMVGSYRETKYAKYVSYKLSEASAARIKKLEKKQDALMHPITV